METFASDPQKTPKPAEGKLADNIVYFARTLRKAGMKVGPAQVNDAIEAVLAAGIGTRHDFYWILHSVLVTRHEDTVVFDEA
ncbi:MAG: VWA domain-containing protein, partial [Oricola sp.]|nr:VWA domain-containing protein [Oricola sp.]